MLVEELGLHGTGDALGFAASLGGTVSKGYAYFNAGRDGQPGAAGKAEAWQILSPVRGQSHGVAEINRLIHVQFRNEALKWAKAPHWQRRIPEPFGIEEIVYGDKIINTANQRRDAVWPKTADALRYVAV